jgi:hypothetical protein
MAEAAGALAERAEDAAQADGTVLIAADATADGGLAAELIGRDGLRVLFTGHLGAGTRGAAAVAAGRASVRRWNVHPTLAENAALAESVGARLVAPAFGDHRHLPEWRTAFAPAAVSLGRLLRL